MAGGRSLESFSDFIESVSSARFDDFRTLPGSEIESAEAFEEWRRHVLDLYEGVEVAHTFMVDGQIVDCVPAEQQPAVRRSGGRPLEPPPLPELPYRSDEAPEPGPESYTTPRPHLHPDYEDALGNRMWCPAGTVPMPRVTLAQVIRSAGLRSARSAGPSIHARGYETVNNVGGASHSNVWKYFVDPGSHQSYAQQWHLAGLSGTVLQTVECGSHVDRNLYAHNRPDDPHLFVYWTADTYLTTGAFNGTDGKFERNSGASYVPGLPLQFSQTDGRQVEYEMGFFLTGGAWWFYFHGQWVGCYRLSLFGDGPLASHSERFAIGGEVRSSTSFWPLMGSGAHAATGFGKAGYHRDILVTPVGEAARSASLTSEVAPPSACYSVDLGSNPTWRTYLYYGGPGGFNC